MEIWKDIIHEGEPINYEVSNSGFIRRRGGLILKTKDNGRGYKKVNLWYNGKQRTQYVHRLVAVTFLENPQNKPAINHKDGNKANNRLDNLEWVSNKENSRHAIVTGLMNREKLQEHMRRISTRERENKKPVVQMDGNGNEIATFPSILSAHKTTGLSKTLISRACRGIYSQGAGYKWKFQEAAQ